MWANCRAVVCMPNKTLITWGIFSVFQRTQAVKRHTSCLASQWALVIKLFRPMVFDWGTGLCCCSGHKQTMLLKQHNSPAFYMCCGCILGFTLGQFYCSLTSKIVVETSCVSLCRCSEYNTRVTVGSSGALFSPCNDLLICELSLRKIGYFFFVVYSIRLAEFRFSGPWCYLITS